MICYICEKFRNELFRMIENPFKFGAIVEDDFFTDRIVERRQLCDILNSHNHVIIISPRRYGKSSLVAKVLSELDRPSVTVNLQSVTGVADLAQHLMRRVFDRFPFERVKYMMTHFRIVPTLSVNPISNGVDLSFQPGVNEDVVLEDVLQLIDRLGEHERMVVVMDEFQEVLNIDKGLDKRLRSYMQTHLHINYVLLGSQESMMETIFDHKTSPFYHFGMLMRIARIPHYDFMEFLTERLRLVCKSPAPLCEQILSLTECHPYYTQQLAFQVWNVLQRNILPEAAVQTAVDEIVQLHDYDYERMWMGMSKTDKSTLSRLATSPQFVLRHQSAPTSTVYSNLKKLVSKGYVIKDTNYRIDDPFFELWIKKTTQ